MNYHLSVENDQMTSKTRGEVASGLVQTLPAYGLYGVRHKGSVILFQALLRNCGNLRWQCKGKGTSLKCKADSTDVPSRDGVTRSSVEAIVMIVERRGDVILPSLFTNCAFNRMSS